MKHLLVIRLSALGDVALMAPVVRRWAGANPDVRFTVAAPPMLAPLFEGMANVDYLGVDKRQSAWHIYRQLASLRCDAVADLHQVSRVGRALLMLRADSLLHLRPLPVRHLRKGRWSRMLMLRHWNMEPRRPQHVRYADVFRRLGLNPPAAAPTPPLAVRPRAGGAVGLAPFAQHQGKIWPLDRAERLVELLVRRGCRVLLFGGRADAELLDAWAARHEGVQSLAGKLSFADELEAIRGLAVMVSMDSANMHFASAVGTPVVSLWGATHPDFGFYGYGQDRRNALCAQLPCQPCSAYGQRPCRLGDRRCLLAITPEQVMERLAPFLDR